MSIIDKERVAAVATPKALGYTFSLTDGWSPPGAGTFVCTTESDYMHSVLMRRADALQGCSEGSPEEAELASIIDAIEKYETKRWPDGKVPGGKG
jgi:hypothetical protein